MCFCEICIPKELYWFATLCSTRSQCKSSPRAGVIKDPGVSLGILCSKRFSPLISQAATLNIQLAVYESRRSDTTHVATGTVMEFYINILNSMCRGRMHPYDLGRSYNVYKVICLQLVGQYGHIVSASYMAIETCRWRK